MDYSFLVDNVEYASQWASFTFYVQSLCTTWFCCKMDVNALSREFYSTDPSANYSAHDTFNLLLLMVCFAQRFSHGTIICKNGVGLHLQERNMLDIDGEEPRKVRIYFYEDKICYWFHNMMHHYTHVPTVKYIYHLMSLMGNVYWMRVVLKKVYTRKVRLLKHMCMMKCPQQHFESTLRRYLTPVEEIMRAFCTNDMLPLTSDAHAQRFLNRLKNTNMYKKFGLHIPEHYRETIYMHQFYFNGIYSDQYNQYTLAYLLVIESILEKRYKWKRIDQNIHYCQIECYHIYIRRQQMGQ